MARHGQAILPEKATCIPDTLQHGLSSNGGHRDRAGVVIHAHTKGQVQQVYADETSALLGARAHSLGVSKARHTLYCHLRQHGSRAHEER